LTIENICLFTLRKGSQSFFAFWSTFSPAGPPAFMITFTIILIFTSCTVPAATSFLGRTDSIRPSSHPHALSSLLAVFFFAVLTFAGILSAFTYGCTDSIMRSPPRCPPTLSRLSALLQSTFLTLWPDLATLFDFTDSKLVL